MTTQDHDHSAVADSTDVRPIEGIIGWVWNEVYRFWVTGPYASDSRHLAEVDDLLAWLNGSPRCSRIEIVNQQANYPSVVIVRVHPRWPPMQGPGFIQTEALTAHEALVAAVRHVAMGVMTGIPQAPQPDQSLVLKEETHLHERWYCVLTRRVSLESSGSERAQCSRPRTGRR